MSNYIDLKYLNLLSPQLSLFKKKGDNLFNFRCPYCGDSQKSKTKARGYVMMKGNDYLFKCHNCGIGANLGNLIKHVSPNLYTDYVSERFLNKMRNEPVKRVVKDISKIWKPSYIKYTPFNEIKKISQLPSDHPARKYVIKRKIPNEYHHKLFYTPKFFAFVNKFIPDKYQIIDKDEPRLIIPLVDAEMKLLGFQGRAFGKSNLRYITTMLNEEAPKIYGLDNLDWNLPIYVVEGPIDSMFVHNSVAMAGADMKNIEMFSGKNCVFVYDNEPRNIDIIKRIDKIINLGHSVVIWPKNVKEKDINDMILANREPEEIQAIISNNTFSGLGAMVKLSEWRKI